MRMNQLGESSNASVMSLDSNSWKLVMMCFLKIERSSLSYHQK